MSSTGKGRVDGQPAYVLHTHPFRETSLIIEALRAITAGSRWWRAAHAGRARRCAGC